MKCKRFVFEGRVQGVCFREKAARVARELGVKGWVRNLSGGGVECVVEGDAGEFLERVKNLSFPVRVDRVTQQDCAPERFDGFKVRASK